MLPQSPLTAPLAKTPLILAALAVLAGCSGEQSDYNVDILVPSSDMHGVHGLAFNSEGELFGASLIGQSVYQINLKNGKVETVIGPTKGNADDVAFGPDDFMVWTAGLENAVYGAGPDGEIKTLASNLPGANSVNFGPDGKLYVTTVFGGDALYEVDPTGATEPRMIAERLGGLNGFEVTDNNTIIGPLFLRGKVVEVSLDDGSVTEIADGFPRPAAVNLDSAGNIIGVDISTGEVFRIDRATNVKSTITKLLPPLDNLAIAEDDTIYVSNSAYNGITEINPETGESRPIVFGGLSSPGGISVAQMDERETLFVSDFWENRSVDAESGAIRGIESDGRLSGATYVATDNNYHYFSTIWPLAVVQILDRVSGKTVKVIGGFQSPYALQPLNDGRLIVADYGANQIVELSADNARSKRVISDEVDGPVGLALAGPNAVYVSEYNAGVVSKINIRTGAKEVIATELAEPEGLARGVDGEIFVAEVGIDQLSVIDPETKVKERIADKMNFGLKGWDAMPAPFIPSSVAVGRTGIVYVTSDMKNALYRLTPK